MFQGQPKKVKKVLLLFFVLTESMISKQVLVYFTVLVLQYCYVKANQNYRHVQTGDCILKMKALINISSYKFDVFTSFLNQLASFLCVLLYSLLYKFIFYVN